MDEALRLLQEIDRVLELGQEGYAKTTEVDAVERDVKNFLAKNLNLDTVLGRKFDKWNSGTLWKPLYPNKYAEKGQVVFLNMFRTFLTDFIEQGAPETLAHQTFINSGAVYTGSRILRDVFSTAKQSIDIQDNFVGLGVLDILEQSFLKNPSLKVRLLTKSGNYKDLQPFIKALPLFTQQFPNILVKSHNNAHGRFFIIDSTLVFSPGASLKDIGKKADLFSEVIEEVPRREMLENFEIWWAEAEIGVSFKTS